MHDPLTKRPVRINTYDGWGGRIVIRQMQLPQVEELLRTNAIRYWLDVGHVSFNNEPPFNFVNVGRETEASRVQALLDAAE